MWTSLGGTFVAEMETSSLKKKIHRSSVALTIDKGSGQIARWR